MKLHEMQEKQLSNNEEMDELTQYAQKLRNAAKFSSQSLKLLDLVTSIIHLQQAPILLRSEFCGRLAEFINSSIIRMAGLKRNSIRIRPISIQSSQANRSNPTEFYQPDDWISLLLCMMVNLSDRTEFCESLIKADQGFNSDSLLNARIVAAPLPLKILDKLDILIDHLQRLHSTREDEMAQWEEIPSEFCDPLVDTLMEDPVILPSGLSCERSVILRHLANKRTDPFTRKPLEADQLKPNIELKQRILEWKQNQKARQTR
jgi:ubiquitin conjugation factor E4 B